MEFIIQNIIEPIIIATSSVMGGSLPIIILLYVYSKKEKNKLSKLINYQKEHIKGLKEKKKTIQSLLDEFTKTFGSANKIISKDFLKDDKEILINILNKTEAEKATIKLEINEAYNFITYAENYNFWTVIEDIIKKRYIGKTFLGEKK